MNDVNRNSLHIQTTTLLARLGVSLEKFSATTSDTPLQGYLPASSPITGELLAHVPVASPDDVSAAITAAHEAFLQWRLVPAPRRGELVRLLGEELRANLSDLGELVTIEAGKILSEGRGEVQEMVDICTFAAGLSRQLGGLTLPSERPHHRMMETWHPLGVVAVISAFNFPVAVWAWNAALALVAGDTVVWKPSEKTPLTALAVQALFERCAARMPDSPKNLSSLLLGPASVATQIVDHPQVPLVSATGSTRMGRAVGPRIAARFGRSILELGGNNAAIVCPSADLGLVLRGVAFSAMGTAGQRCTTLRRLFVHESVYDALTPRLKTVYASAVIGDPRDPRTLVGPLIDRTAYEAMQAVLEHCRSAGATVTGGERVDDPELANGFYVRPALVEVGEQNEQVRSETFAPILYVLRYRELETAISLQNDVPQGLSSSIFTTNLLEAEVFLSATGSDCGIANVNIGTSGAEIGGAFGGEKETGGGRESGSDAWKQYMRRATNTINFGSDLPLAQGVSFDID